MVRKVPDSSFNPAQCLFCSFSQNFRNAAKLHNAAKLGVEIRCRCCSTLSMNTGMSRRFLSHDPDAPLVDRHNAERMASNAGEDILYSLPWSRSGDRRNQRSLPVELMDVTADRCFQHDLDALR